jgi:regulator of protease activity HflC (stomatin/prohibitin superfamily)
MNTVGFWLAALLVLSVAAVSTVRMAWEYQRAVIFRFGRLKGLRGPGLFLLIPWPKELFVWTCAPSRWCSTPRKRSPKTASP